MKIANSVTREHLEKIYAKYNRYFNGKEKAYYAIKLFLEDPKKIIFEIISGYVCGCEWSYTIMANNFDKEKHLILDDAYFDGEFHVVDQCMYDEILYEFYEVYSMPKKLPNNTNIKCTNITELITIIQHANPIWILEMHAIFSSMEDKARCYPSELKYSVNELEVKKIIKQLKNIMNNKKLKK